MNYCLRTMTDDLVPVKISGSHSPDADALRRWGVRLSIDKYRYIQTEWSWLCRRYGHMTNEIAIRTSMKSKLVSKSRPLPWQHVLINLLLWLVGKTLRKFQVTVVKSERVKMWGVESLGEDCRCKRSFIMMYLFWLLVALRFRRRDKGRCPKRKDAI